MQREQRPPAERSYSDHAADARAHGSTARDLRIARTRPSRDGSRRALSFERITENGRSRLGREHRGGRGQRRHAADRRPCRCASAGRSARQRQIAVRRSTYDGRRDRAAPHPRRAPEPASSTTSAARANRSPAPTRVARPNVARVERCTPIEPDYPAAAVPRRAQGVVQVPRRRSTTARASCGPDVVRSAAPVFNDESVAPRHAIRRYRTERPQLPSVAARYIFASTTRADAAPSDDGRELHGRGVVAHLRDQLVDRVETPLRAHEPEVAQRELLAVERPVEIEQPRLDGARRAVERRVGPDRDEPEVVAAVVARRDRGTRRRAAAASRAATATFAVGIAEIVSAARAERDRAAQRVRRPEQPVRVLDVAGLASPRECACTRRARRRRACSAPRRSSRPRSRRCSRANATSPARLCPKRKFAPTTIARALHPPDQRVVQETAPARATRSPRRTAARTLRRCRRARRR